MQRGEINLVRLPELTHDILDNIDYFDNGYETSIIRQNTSGTSGYNLTRRRCVDRKITIGTMFENDICILKANGMVIYLGII